MQTAELTLATKSNFDLKNNQAVLIAPQESSGRATMSLHQLEAIRTARSAVPASKYGLEVICGGSCETGAQ